MKKNIYFLIVALVIYAGCEDVEDDYFNTDQLKRAPFVSFDQDPDFLVDIFEPETAIFEAVLNDNGNATQRFELILSYTNEEGEVFVAEEFKVIEVFPHNLQISLVEIAEALELNANEIQENTIFNFSSRSLGKDGTIYSGESWLYDEDEYIAVEDENGEITHYLDPGTAKKGGDLHENLDYLTNRGYKSAMSFRLITFIPPPPIYRFTSFETVPVPVDNDEYCRNGEPDETGDLVNNEGEPHVDHVATGTGPDDEIGFNSEFINNGDDGFTCEQLGVLGFGVDDSDQGSWPDGEQGYYAEDVDGILKITFDRVEIPAEHPQTGIRIDAFLRDVGYESGDYLHIYVKVEKSDGSEETLDLVDADDDMMETLSDTLLWHTFDSGLMSGVSAYTLVAEFAVNSSSERIYLDYLLIYLPRE